MATPAAPIPRAPKKAKANGKEKHSIQIQFSTEEDINLYNYLEQMAKADRRPLPLYVLLQLHNAIAIPVDPETE